MATLIAIGFIVLAAVMYFAVSRGWIHSDALQNLAHISGVVALMVAVVTFASSLPATQSSSPTSTPASLTVLSTSALNVIAAATPLAQSTHVSTSLLTSDAGATADASPSGSVHSSAQAAPLPQWVMIPAGEFVMGSSEDDILSAVAVCNEWEGNCQFDWFDSELPSRSIYLPEFAITLNEITNEQYAGCVEAGVCQQAGRYVSYSNILYSPTFKNQDYPVVAVNWYDAQAYCNWLDGRLPSEEEWEKAARGMDARMYPWGNALDTERANLASGSPAPVGSHASGASPYGVNDMGGNAFEWTSSSDNNRYVLRGGSWFAPPYRARTADRGTKLAGENANYDIGFRCVRD